MRPIPRPFCSSVCYPSHKKRDLLAIGQTEEGGPVVCYLLREEGQHSEVVYLYTGFDGYQMWRRYMLELGRWQKSDGRLERFEQPQISEIEKLLEETSTS